MNRVSEYYIRLQITKLLRRSFSTSKTAFTFELLPTVIILIGAGVPVFITASEKLSGWMVNYLAGNCL